MKIKTFALALLGVCMLAGGVAADDVDDLIGNVKRFVEEKNYPKALEELTWLKKEIEKLNSASITDKLPKELLGFTGKEAQIQSVMGVTSIKKEYVKDQHIVTCTLTQMGGDTMGGLAGIGRMAAAMAGDQNTVRISGRTAQIEESEYETKLTVFMESGGILELNSTQANFGRSLKQMAEALPLNDLDNYLKGQQ